MSKPIQIDPELAAKYEGPGQFETFDAAFRKIVNVPADPAAIPPLPEEEGKKPRGRPRKSEA